MPTPEPWQQSYLYPGPLLVRNTFIDDPLGHDSLEGFLQERQAFSCPVSRISEPGSGVEDKSQEKLGPSSHGSLPSEPDKALVPQVPREDGSDCSTASTDTQPNQLADGPKSAPQEMDFSQFGVPLSSFPLPDAWARTNAKAPDFVASPFPYSMLAMCGEGDPGDPFARVRAVGPLPEPPPCPPWEPTLPPQVLRLEEALRDEEASAVQVHQAAALAAAEAIGATHEEQVAAANAFASASSITQETCPEREGDLPSAGSTGHYLGQCRPCAFSTTKGCSSGKDCQFCHLCGPGEKKRRQKAKRAFFGALAEMQRVLESEKT